MTTFATLNADLSRLVPDMAGAPLAERARAVPHRFPGLDHRARSLCSEVASYAALGEYERAHRALAEVKAAISAHAEAVRAPVTAMPPVVAELLAAFGVDAPSDVGRAHNAAGSVLATAGHVFAEPLRRLRARDLTATELPLDARVERFAIGAVLPVPARSVFGSSAELLADVKAEERNTLESCADDRGWFRAFATSLGVDVASVDRARAKVVGQLEAAIREHGTADSWLAVFWLRELRRYIASSSMPVEGQPEPLLAIDAVRLLGALDAR